jgi:hypothetical protein
VGSAVINEIAEGQLLRLTVRTLTADLAAVVPTSLRYRIDDLVQGCAVLDWTAVTPALPANILVTAAQNTARSNYLRERRQVIVEASDSDGPIREVYEYDLLNLPVV